MRKRVRRKPCALPPPRTSSPSAVALSRIGSAHELTSAGGDNTAAPHTRAHLAPSSKDTDKVEVRNNSKDRERHNKPAAAARRVAAGSCRTEFAAECDPPVPACGRCQNNELADT